MFHKLYKITLAPNPNLTKRRGFMKKHKHTGKAHTEEHKAEHTHTETSHKEDHAAEHTHHHAKKADWRIIAGIVLIVVALAVLGVKFLPKILSPGAGVTTTSEKVKLEFYVMSQCPYGTQVEDAVKPALDSLEKMLILM
jgi:hypothetical protein